MDKAKIEKKENTEPKKRQVDNRRKILLIFCGGTIAMAPNEKTGALEPAKDVSYLLSLMPSINTIANIDSLSLFNLDSTELTAKHWVEIAKTIHENYQYYDGFIVTHGTDTMADSATAVSFALGSNINKPVVFTGAQVYPGKIGSDAKMNLENAFRIVTSDVRGVMIVFGHYVLLASRSQKRHEADFNAFDSPAMQPLAMIRSDISWNALDLVLKLPETKNIILVNEFSSKILCLKVNASLSPQIIEKLVTQKGISGLVFESLGAGNIPSRYIPIIKEATKLNIPTLIASPFVGGSTAHADTYSLGYEALKAGVVPTNDMTFIAAYIKLMWCLPQIEKKIKNGEMSENNIISVVKEMFATNYVNEVTL